MVSERYVRPQVALKICDRAMTVGCVSSVSPSARQEAVDVRRAILDRLGNLSSLNRSTKSKIVWHFL